METTLFDNYSDSNFSYSEDSEESRGTLLSIDFNKEFSLSHALSLKEKIENYKDSIGSTRNSLENTEMQMHQYKVNLIKLEERISIKDSELNTLCSTINTCTNELNEVSHRENSMISLKVNEKREELQQELKKTHQRVMKAELDHIIKEYQLIALRDYHKNIIKAEDIEIADMMFNIDLLEKKRNALNKIKKKHIHQADINSLFTFVDENIKNTKKNSISDIASKYKEKSKEILLAEYKFWSLSHIFHEIKAQIKEEYAAKTNYIRENIKKYYEQVRTDKEYQMQALKADIQNANTINLFDYSSKPTLLLALKIYSMHLNSIDKKISKLHRRHRKSQKKMIIKVRELSSTELKLARLKSLYFLKDL